MRFHNTAHALVREVLLLSICADLWIKFFSSSCELEFENGCLLFLSRTWTSNSNITRTL